jgi:uncharacterized protein
MKDEILEKREEVTALFDAYKGTLTAVQRDVFQDYYLYDLSLSEIAENRSISRSAVSDALKKAVAKLEGLEKEVAFAKKKSELRGLCSKVDEAPDETSKEKALNALVEYINHAL